MTDDERDGLLCYVELWVAMLRARAPAHVLPIVEVWKLAVQLAAIEYAEQRRNENQ